MIKGDMPFRQLNRLVKWKNLLAGWQLGTRPKGDPESDAVRDHRELTLILRAEVNALTALLVEKGVFTSQEMYEQTEKEAEYLNERYEKDYPGVRAVDDGLVFDKRVEEWMKGWKP